MWYFLIQKLDGNMRFTDYWKVLVLIFSGIGNTVFWSQKVDGKRILTGCRKVIVLDFLLMVNTGFFEPKGWWKDNTYLVFLTFPWYSRIWEIWFFVQWILKIVKILRTFIYRILSASYTFPKFYLMIAFFELLWVQNWSFSYFLCHCFVFSVRMGSPWLFSTCFYTKTFSKYNSHKLYNVLIRNNIQYHSDFS